jgi:hypothetical protein
MKAFSWGRRFCFSFCCFCCGGNSQQGLRLLRDLQFNRDGLGNSFNRLFGFLPLQWPLGQAGIYMADTRDGRITVLCESALNRFSFLDCGGDFRIFCYSADGMGARGTDGGALAVS